MDALQLGHQNSDGDDGGIDNDDDRFKSASAFTAAVVG